MAKEQLKNTIEFEHFNLLADSTLKSMNKDALVSYVHMLYNNWKSTDIMCNNVINYAKTLQDENECLRGEVCSYRGISEARGHRLNELEMAKWVKPSNSFLGFEELKLYIPFWDKKEKEWCYFTRLHEECKTGVKISIGEIPYINSFKYEKERFYRREVKENE